MSKPVKLVKSFASKLRALGVNAVKKIEDWWWVAR